MAEQIFIRLNPDPENVDWWILDAQGHRRGGIGHARLDALAPHLHARQVRVIVSSNLITFTEVRLPARSRRRWEEAIPFALEEMLASDVEDLHFAHGESDATGHLPVAVVNRDQMGKWMAHFDAAGIRPDALWPDLFLVPWTKQTWSLAREKDRIILRWAQEQGCCLEDTLAEAVFNRLWASVPAERHPREIVFYGTADDPFWQTIQAGPGRETLAWTQGGTSACEEASRGPLVGINLLQGSWSPGHHRQETWSRWKPSVYLAAAWVGLLALYLLIRVINIESQASSWRTRVHQAFHAALPGQPYVSPRAQIEQALRQSGGESRRTTTFLEFLAHASDERPAPIRIHALHYGPSGLELDFDAPSRPLAESYVHELSRTTHLNPLEIHWQIKPGHVRAFIHYAFNPPPS